MEEQIKPSDWANEHGLKVDVVMKLLRDAGVTVRTQVSKVAASDYEKIEEAAAVEKQKQDSRSKNLKSSTASDSQESAPKKKAAAESVTTKNGVTIRRVRATTKPKAAADKPATAKAKAATAPAKESAPVTSEPKVTPASETPAPEAKSAAPAKAAPVEVPAEPKAEPAPVKTDPKPTAAAKPAVAKPAEPTMMSSSTELKQPPMKAQVFKPDAAILARIAKSQQQQQGGRGLGNRRPGGPGARGQGNARISLAHRIHRDG